MGWSLPKPRTLNNGAVIARKAILADVRDDYQRLYGVGWEERWRAAPRTEAPVRRMGRGDRTDRSVCANQNNFHKNSILVSDLSLNLRWGSQLLSCSLRHVGSFRAATSIGIFRKRLPVAAKIALAMAGTIADVPVSPIPPGGSALLTMWTSMAGASFMRSIW
jgi:hypothetical protein